MADGTVPAPKPDTKKSPAKEEENINGKVKKNIQDKTSKKGRPHFDGSPIPVRSSSRYFLCATNSRTAMDKTKYTAPRSRNEKRRKRRRFCYFHKTS